MIMIMHNYSAEQQTAKQTLTTSKNSIEFPYSHFPCHLKVNRNILALINRLWKYKMGERLTITAHSFMKIGPQGILLATCAMAQPIKLQHFY